MRHKGREQTACKGYEARLEDHLSGTQAPPATNELEAHLAGCAGCREALEAARVSRQLLQESLESAGTPSGAFATRVVAAIHAEENRRLAAADFWRPLETLASRLAWTAAVALLVMTAFFFQFRATGGPGRFSTQTEISEGFPELGGQPAAQDEVLMTLAEGAHGQQTK